MKVTFWHINILAIAFFLWHRSPEDKKINKLDLDGKPGYLDNGRTIDSLKGIFNCESIEYDNWAEKKASDSCLTVSFINSTKVPSLDNIDYYVGQFKGIAAAIKKSLMTPPAYKTFYIIFVKKETLSGQDIRTHTAGMEIISEELSAQIEK